MATVLATTDRASKGQGLPRLDPGTGHYKQPIGFRMDRASKERKRRFFSFGRDQKQAYSQSAENAREWETITNDWTTLRQTFEETFPTYDWSKPVWVEEWMQTEALRLKQEAAEVIEEVKVVEKERKETIHRMAVSNITFGNHLDPAALAQVLTALGLVAIPANSPVAPKATVSLKDAKDRFLTDQKARIGRGGGKGLKVSTYNQLWKSTHLVFGFTAKGHMEGHPLSPDINLHDLDDKQLKKLVNFWMDKKGVSSRTAINYINMAKNFFRWAEANLDFQRPKILDSNDYRFELPKTVKAIGYEEALPQLKKLSEVATDWALLHALLGLNGGLYSKDISDLRDTDLINFEGRPCLWWLRSKETMAEDAARVEDGKDEQKAFRILTPLWPETARLVEKFRARKNPHNRLFLNTHGLPLVRFQTETQCANAVAQTFDNVMKAAIKALGKEPKKRITFKQLRKIVWNLVKTLSEGNTHLSNLWAGQKNNAIDFNYDDAQPAAYRPLFPVLDQIREKLIRDGVLRPATEEKSAA